MAREIREEPGEGPDAGAVATTFPSRYLPPVTYREMPEPLSLRKVLGPGVIAAGIGLASGEFILWPYITSQVGLVFLWAAVIGVVTQFFINMEIERYTLATGETALTGFSRYWRHWGLVFAALTFLANAWPGWITSSATLVTFIFDGGSVKLLAILGLAAIAIALTMAPVVYTMVERIEFFKVGIILFFIVVAIATAITAEAWAALPDAVTNFGRIPEGLDLALLLPALAFAGAGGGQNLVQSNWMRDKGYGMGVHIPHLASPVTGQPEAAPGTGYAFREDERNLARWKGWWEVANKEQLVSFVAITIVTIALMSLLAYSTVFGIDGENNISFLEAEGNALIDRVGSWFGYLFWVIGATSLFAAALGIVDYTCRMLADVLKVSYLRDNDTWSESRIYFVAVWLLCLWSVVILLAIQSQPLILLIISASIGGFMMFIYSGLLILVNRRSLPPSVRITGFRTGTMIWSVLLFGTASVVAVTDQWDNIKELFGL
ncbi:MAG TPA: Nramp family divalent metal transporter [Actinomycetes bacterium]|nr:Nramp family divalent metal transporter [Actinomycetes bacterium]